MVVMMKRKTLAISMVLVVLVASLSLTLIYAHDNPANLTPILSINTGNTSIGSNVTIKGNITSIIMLFIGFNDQVVTINDGSGNLEFFWTRTKLDIGWSIIVKGTVSQTDVLYPVSSVEPVILFP